MHLVSVTKTEECPVWIYLAHEVNPAALQLKRVLQKRFVDERTELVSVAQLVNKYMRAAGTFFCECTPSIFNSAKQAALET
jgi:hypothetical protein